MARVLRLVSLAALAALALVVAGCNDKQDAYHEAKTEGPYLQAGPLVYQIQLSRELNARAPFDREILRGLPAGETLRKGEEWFGIWLRAENPTERPELSAVNFDIVDTLQRRYDPISIPPGANPLIYRPTTLRAGGVLPVPGTLQSQGGPRGQIILFKLNASAYQNRPLIFTIRPASGEKATVELDL